MTQEPVLHPDSPSVQTHLNIMQGVIQRMAENSRACKFWCVTIVSATLVLVARQAAVAIPDAPAPPTS